MDSLLSSIYSLCNILEEFRVGSRLPQPTYEFYIPLRLVSSVRDDDDDPRIRHPTV